MKEGRKEGRKEGECVKKVRRYPKKGRGLPQVRKEGYQGRKI
jgi:hypothetical protein